MKYTLIPVLTASSVFIIGIMIGAITVVGDLVESMFKRDAGVKDSGIIIPGHGGILDKLDGALFAGPVLFWLIITIKVIR
jgi:phosphatidate cytidylyltransferase